MIKGPCLSRLLLAVVAATALLGPVPAPGGVNGTPHDMTLITGEIFKGACVYCHVPHKAQGERLWMMSALGPNVGWGGRPIAQLCYTCHDSTGGGYGAENMVNTAFSDRSHGFTVGDAPLAPDKSVQPLGVLPYAATFFLDCTTCHDPHANTPPFLRRGAVDALCKECHGRENAGSLGAKNKFGAAEAPYSLHPTDVPFSDDPANGVTSLHPLPEILKVPTATGNWKLGAHRVGWEQETGNISCETCHPVHGGYNYAQGIMPGPPASALTPVENQGGTTAALCQSCHQGGDTGELVGTLSDHPINRNDGTPATVFPAGWPTGVNREVTCSSCHDAHGGAGGTSLLRQDGAAADGWCFSCHSVAALTPAYHHSCRENDDPEVFLSVLTCGDCHGTGAGWSAHNGFEGFKVTGTTENWNSALCESCHTPRDPIALDAARYQAASGIAIAFTGAVYPSLHGPVPGTLSHVVNEADDDSVSNCQIKTTAWAKTGAVSRYGPASQLLCESCHSIQGNAGLLLGADTAALLTGGWKANLLVEPYEDNSAGVGDEKPDWFAGPTLSGLCRGCHYAVKEGVPPSFVHNPAAHTVENYVYPAAYTPYGRSGVGLLTTPIDSTGPECPEVSSADQRNAPSGKGVAPGAFSYPAANTMDCDSCHRPHGAHDAGLDGAKILLLELSAIGAQGTVPCAECHDTNQQCGYTITTPAAP